LLFWFFLTKFVGMKRTLLILFVFLFPTGFPSGVDAPFQAVAQPTQPAPARGSGASIRKPDLVELIRLDSTIHLDIRYATENNFMKRRMYDTARAFLQRPAADAVVRVQKKLRTIGLGLVIFDAYRPWSVTKQFWDETPVSKHSFVADPKVGSKHNRGCAVDLSLYDLTTGLEITMPSGYDEFSKRASPKYTGGTAEQRRWRDLLRSAMEGEGFTVDPGEWWHFDYQDWKLYPVMNEPL
jgi:D-alanyl-D-alanine dipeptidase